MKIASRRYENPERVVKFGNFSLNNFFDDRRFFKVNNKIIDCYLLKTKRESGREWRKKNENFCS